MSVAQNLTEILRRIDAAAKKAGRSPENIQLVAVTKTKPLAMVDEAAVAAEQILGKNQSRVIFGENYVQEAVEKIASRPNYQWDFIGSFQSNKVKEVVGKVGLIHSIDRFKIASEVSKEANKRNLIQDVLLQIRIGDEESKHGFGSDEIFDVFPELMKLSGIRLSGLMALPPLSDDLEVSRSYFTELRELMMALRTRFLNSNESGSFDLLSMGTTADFEMAIEEGATHVRVGTAIFGERERKGN